MTPAVFTTQPHRRQALHESLATRPLLVVGLCAAWCGTCGEFRAGFESIAASRDDTTFVWLDIEDDAALAGDIDVDNFPTLGVYERGRLVHFGVSLPQPGVVARLLDALSHGSRTIDSDEAVVRLPERLAAAAARSL